MSSVILDRSGRLQRPPDFLAALAAPDRQAGRVAVFVALAIPAALLAAVVAGVGVTIAAAVLQARRGDLAAFSAAFGALSDSGRAGRSLASYVYEFAVAGVASYAAALAVLAIAARAFGRRVRSFLTAARRFRWRAVAAGLALGLPLTTLAFLLERLMEGPAPGAPILTPGAPLLGRLEYGLAAVVFLYLAAFAEEAVFRGWLLQQTAAWTRSLPLILALNGVVFSLAHFDPDPAGFAVRAVMGAGWAWLALRTAGVEFTTGAHLANNLFVALFVMPVKFVAPKAAGPANYGSALLELGLVLAMAIVVEAWLRRRGRPIAADVPPSQETADGAPTMNT